eukprot:2079280-Ditylum_brightwellii.AAC.1
MDAIAQVIEGQDIQDGEAAYLLVKSLMKGDALQVFKNKEASQDVKDSPAFTKCLTAVTEHVSPKKAYKNQKKYIRNILPDGVTTTKVAGEEFVDILGDGVRYQWKLDFEKE